MTGDSAEPDDPSQSPFFRAFPDPLLCYETSEEDAVVRAVNPAFEATFGGDGETVADDPLADHLLVGAVEVDSEEALSRLDAGERVTVATRRGPDGEPRHFRLRAFSTPGDGASDYIVYTEVTDSKRRAADLEARGDRLERFASVAAHDLRNPLDVAKIRLEAARDTGEAVHFEKAAAALDRIERIIRDVLSVGGAELEPRDGVAIDAVAEAAWSTVDTADATLVLEDDLPTVEADADLLQQSFENLFRNAVEHGSRDVTVTVGRLADGGFYVADDGPGVPPEDREQVFEPGYSTADDNTGLGLAIVQQIAEEHGWRVSLTAGDDGGARFEFSGVVESKNEESKSEESKNEESKSEESKNEKSESEKSE